MSDDLDGMAYKSRLEDSVPLPPPERGPIPPGGSSERLSYAERFSLAGDRLMKRMFTVGGILAVVIGLIWLLSLLLPPGDGPTTPDEGLGTPDGGLLADLRGEDVLHRLQTTQVALKREMAMIREAVATRGGVPLPDDVDTAYALAAHTAELERLGALVNGLEADQWRLRDLVEASQAGLALLSERLESLEQALEAQRAGERN